VNEKLQEKLFTCDLQSEATVLTAKISTLFFTMAVRRCFNFTVMMTIFVYLFV